MTAPIFFHNWHTVTGRKATIPHHSRDFAGGTLRAVLREAGIVVEDFLNAGGDGTRRRHCAGNGVGEPVVAGLKH